MGKALTSADSSRVPLQLVCKSWREACWEHFGGLDYAAVKIDKSLDLRQACKMMPRVVDLCVRCRTAFSLRPLSALSCLSGLQLIKLQPEKDTAPLKLRPLPLGLKSLEISWFEVDPSHFEFIQCTQLTSLTFLWFMFEPEYDMSLLLDRLPQLQVRFLTYSLQNRLKAAFVHHDFLVV